MEALVDELVGEALTFEDDISMLTGHPFYIDAVKHGSFTHGTTGLTIIVPLKYKASDEDELLTNFSQLWARHVFPSAIMFGGRGSGVLQPTSVAEVVYSVDETSIAGCPFNAGFCNIQHQGCFFHGIDVEELPSLRMTMDSLCSLQRMYLSGQDISLSFEKLGIESLHPPWAFTIMASFNRDDRTPVGNKYQNTWEGSNTVCNLKTPIVNTREELMLWLQLYDRCKGYAIVIRRYPWYLEIQPNVNITQDLQIFDMNPHSGDVNDQLWIRGVGFVESIVRVFVGKQAAVIFHSSDNLLCCYIPEGSGSQAVRVCNGPVYKTHFHMFTYK